MSGSIEGTALDWPWDDFSSYVMEKTVDFW